MESNSQNREHPNNREMSLDEAITSLEKQTDAQVRKLNPAMRELKEEEASLEARLERALPPEMRARLVKAFSK